MELELKELIERDLTQAVVGRIHDPQFYPFWETVIKSSKLTLKILRDGFKGFKKGLSLSVNKVAYYIPLVLIYIHERLGTY